MALHEDERSRCPDPQCGCAIHVIKGAQPGSGGDPIRAAVAGRTYSASHAHRARWERMPAVHATVHRTASSV